MIKWKAQTVAIYLSGLAQEYLAQIEISVDIFVNISSV